MKQVNKKKTKTNKVKRRKRWLTLLGVIAFCIAGFLGYRYYKDHQSYRFDTPDEADLFVVAQNGISSFSYQDGLLQETSHNSFKLIEHGLNNYINRPIIQNRYLLLSDYYGPSWKTGRFVSIDFELGKVLTKTELDANNYINRPIIQNRYLLLSDYYGPSWKTGRFVSIDFELGKVLTKTELDAGSQTTGQSSEYFFISQYNYYDTYLAVYSPNLELVDKYVFNRPIYANSFSVDGNQIYMYGLSMADNENIASYLYHFDLVDGQLNLVQETRLDTADVTTYYGNSALVENKLVTTIRGGRNVVTGQENVVLPTIIIDDILTGERQTVTSERYDYHNIFDLRNGLVAIDYSDTSSSNVMSFTLLNIHDLSNHFITIDPQYDYHNIFDLRNGLVAIDYSDTSSSNVMSFTLLNIHDLSNHFITIDPQPYNVDQTEYLQSIRRLDADRILVLTSKAIWIYNMTAQQFESQHQLPSHIEGAFDIWAA